jgi:FkbM family methyltransferase
MWRPLVRAVLPVRARTWIKDTVRIRLPQHYRRLLHGDTSQFGEVSNLRKLLPPGLPKWIVDVGAHDGYTTSNSYPFVSDGWNAVLIEPLPDNFRKLKELYNGNPRVQLVHSACGDKAGILPFYIKSDPKAASFEATLCSDDAPGRAWTHSAQTIPVQVELLTDILRRTNCPPEFGILDVDAEGFDLEVLKGLDFHQFRPMFILSEANDERPDKNEEKFNLLTQNGYQFVKQVVCNSIWRRV